MEYLIDVIMIGLSAALINNFVLHYFVGICPFIGVSRRIGMAVGMGCAVTFVIVIAAFISWFVTYFVLMPGAPLTSFIAGLFVPAEMAKSIDLTILCYLVYIFAIAASVQFVEMYLRKFFPPLYQSLGVYLPLITTNCAILFACLTIMANIVGAEHPWDIGRSLMLGFGGGVGFTIAIVIMAGIREELDLCDVPKAFKGVPITLVVAGILALAFMGFTGVDNGLRAALAKEVAPVEAAVSAPVAANTTDADAADLPEAADEAAPVRNFDFQPVSPAEAVEGDYPESENYDDARELEEQDTQRGPASSDDIELPEFTDIGRA